ncbi:hypothetical protein ScPMuIL_017354 [Solemya velum]
MSAEDKEQTEIEKEEKKQQRPVPTPRKRQPQSRKQEVLVTGDKRQDSTVTCDTAEQTSDEEEYLANLKEWTVGEEEIDPGDRLAEDDRNAIRDAQPEGSPERAPRRSQRSRRPPRWHDTYNMSQISKSPGSSDRSDAIKALICGLLFTSGTLPRSSEISNKFTNKRDRLNKREMSFSKNRPSPGSNMMQSFVERQLTDLHYTCSQSVSNYRDKVLAFFFGATMVVLLPYLHIGVFYMKIWVPDKPHINKKSCKCTCFDTIMRGAYENPGTTSYKHVYFNATWQTFRIWIVTVIFILMAYESAKYIASSFQC